MNEDIRHAVQWSTCSFVGPRPRRGLTAFGRYRRDMKEIIAEVERGGAIADTPAGLIEYASAKIRKGP